MSSEKHKMAKSASSRKLASTIITPTRLDFSMEENVTVRERGDAMALSFDSTNDKEPMNVDDQIIGDDMEIV